MANNNLTFRDHRKYFSDDGDSIKLAAYVTHGAIETYSGDRMMYLPNTWVNIAVVPSTSEKPEDFMKRMGMYDHFEALAQHEGRSVAEEAVQNGVPFVRWKSAYPIDQSPFDIEGVVETLSGKKNGVSDNAVRQAVERAVEYLSEEATPEKLTEAAAAYKRTGGRGSDKMVRS